MKLPISFIESTRALMGMKSIRNYPLHWSKSRLLVSG